jgi:hypothetical protein
MGASPEITQREPLLIMMRASAMAGESYPQGLLDTTIVTVRKWIDPGGHPRD